jgi:hypothetical protein
MTKDEARLLLVEQGALVLTAQRKVYEARETLATALHPLMEAESDGLGLLFDADEQEQCFHESCYLASEDPLHPAFAPQRRAIESKRGDDHQGRLLEQLQNAEWN